MDMRLDQARRRPGIRRRRTPARPPATRLDRDDAAARDADIDRRRIRRVRQPALRTIRSIAVPSCVAAMLARRMRWRNPTRLRAAPRSRCPSAYSRIARSEENQPTSRGVQHAGAPPGAPVAPARGHLALRGDDRRRSPRSPGSGRCRPDRRPARGSGAARPARTRPTPIASSTSSQHRRRGDGLARAQALAPARSTTCVRRQAEDEDVVVADALADLDIGAVQRADGQRAVQRQLHVAGAGRLHARRWRSAPTGRRPE